MGDRASEAQVRCWIVALEQDANELLTAASVYLQRAPKDKALAERTGDIERGIAAELEASLVDRADAARYRALKHIVETFGDLSAYQWEDRDAYMLEWDFARTEADGFHSTQDAEGETLDAAVDALIARQGGEQDAG